MELGNAILHSGLTGRPVELPLDGTAYESALLERIRTSTVSRAPGDTPVIRQCTIPIPIDVEQASDDSYTPLPSRIAHLAVIDILAVGVSKTKGESVDRHLSKLNRGLQSLRTGD